MTTVDIYVLEAEIARLVAEYPELAEDEALRSDMLEGSTDLDEVLTRLARRVRYASTSAKVCASEMGEISSRRARYERQEEAARSVILRLLSAADLPKRELPIATLSVGKPRAKVLITDESAIPVFYQRVKVEPAKDEIKKALEEGHAVPGATLSNSEPSLTIRVK